jgi:nicotinic acid phosphoribosyltransferase
MKGLYTDLYEVRMATAYRRRRMTGPATFSLFVRRLPAGPRIPDRRRPSWSRPRC